METNMRYSRKRRRQTRLQAPPKVSASGAWLSLAVSVSTWTFLLLQSSERAQGFIPVDTFSAPSKHFGTLWPSPISNLPIRQLTAYGRSILGASQAASKDFDEYAVPSSRSPSRGEGSEDNFGSLRRMRSSSGGLSRFHQSILSRTSAARQCFVTGRYPLSVTFRDCPTRKWLRWESTSELLVNETSLTKSLASLDRFQWLDSEERNDLVEAYDMVSVEFLAEIHVERPGYLQVMPSCQAGSTAAEQRARSNTYTFFQQSSEATFGSTSWANTGGIHRRFDVADCPALPTDRLWVTGFSLAGRTGHLYSIEGDSGEIETVNKRTRASLLWPNEVTSVPSRVLRPSIDEGADYLDDAAEAYDDALLIADGFLVPGKDRGGLYVVKHPGNPDAEWTVRLTSTSSTHPDHNGGDGATISGDRWFYHRASWVDLTGDGRLSVLTARCRLSTRFSGVKSSINDEIASGISKQGELVWLECPRPYKIDKATGTPLEADGTVFDPFSANNLPWKEHVLASGPDVMFCLAELGKDGSGDGSDTIEVMCSEFFNRRVTVKSIQKGPRPRVVFERTIDDRCGAAFGCIPAFLDGFQSDDDDGYPVVLDAGSTVQNLKEGDNFSHLLVTSHECSYVDTDEVPRENNLEMNDENSPPLAEVATDRSLTDGGSLFAYRVPRGSPGAWKTEPWLRSTVATGFKVQGQLGNMINPGAPGFVYTFHAREDEENPHRRPLIAVAGDCAESAYLFRPNKYDKSGQEGAICPDPSTFYKLMVEIKCGATVGSIAVGYDDFLSVEQESGYAKLYIPCFEKDKIMVFALGSGDDGYGSDTEDW